MVSDLFYFPANKTNPWGWKDWTRSITLVTLSLRAIFLPSPWLAGRMGLQ